MLRKVRSSQLRACGGRFAIVASRYNARYVDAMVRAARAELRRAGADRVEVVRVPGAFEIPVVAARLSRGAGIRPDAVVCLGVVLRGETSHADHIGRGVTEALVQLQIQTGVPMIHEVLLLDNEAQARVRCLSRDHNRGTEAAQSAIEMVRVLGCLEGWDDRAPHRFATPERDDGALTRAGRGIRCRA